MRFYLQLLLLSDLIQSPQSDDGTFLRSSGVFVRWGGLSSWMNCQFTYIGVKQINAVQALAPVNAALDAAEWWLALTGARWGGCCDGAGGRAGVYPGVSGERREQRTWVHTAWLLHSKTYAERQKKKRKKQRKKKRRRRKEHTMATWFQNATVHCCTKWHLKKSISGVKVSEDLWGGWVSSAGGAPEAGAVTEQFLEPSVNPDLSGFTWQI